MNGSNNPFLAPLAPLDLNESGFGFNPYIQQLTPALNDLLIHPQTSVPTQPVVVVSQPAPVVAKVQSFGGFMKDDGRKFLSDFESYLILAGIDINTPRAVAAFHLHLSGPAQTWFDSLETKSTWEEVRGAFLKEFCSMDSPNFIAESALFENLRLLPNEQIEVFYAALVDKGKTLGKSCQDMLQKFISGLPQQLAFFVRAGRVTTLKEALQSAKIGEAHGYRSHGAVQHAYVPPRIDDVQHAYAPVYAVQPPRMDDVQHAYAPVNAVQPPRMTLCNMHF